MYVIDTFTTAVPIPAFIGVSGVSFMGDLQVS